MSTKIYFAWRIKPIHFNGFLDKYRKFIFNNAKKVFFDYAASMEIEEINNYILNDKIKFDFKDENKKIEFYRYKLTIQEAIYSSFSDLRLNNCDIDGSLNVWFYKNYFYVIPYCSFQISKFKKPPFAEDYCYFNNTDKPRNISQKNWSKRSKIWNEVCLNDWNKYRMEYDIICAKKESTLRDFCKFINLNDIRLLYGLKFSSKNN